MKLTPLGDKVIAVRIEASEKVGSIFIPEAAREYQHESCGATVVSLGTGGIDKHGNRIPFEVKVGDQIVIDRNRGIPFEVGGRVHIIIPCSDILAVLN